MDTDSLTQKKPSAAAIAATIDAWQTSGQERWWPTAGDSMRPLITHGDEVLIKFDLDDLRCGDIVVFGRDLTRSDGLIAHRVIQIRQIDLERTILTKGDNCALADAPVTAQDILGRVVAIKHAGACIRTDTATWRRRARMIAAWSRAEYSCLNFGRRTVRWLPLPRPLPGSGSVLRLGQAVSRAMSSLLKL